ncbi:hypothetical protein BDY19DRAFT_236263 [Irpex rosettiformis]|uniref:Uncharacterized protein n=1 Tax=Irpex rosettiformis TaxID=378272 RepID=A0ACB8TZN7_9APHY|nr:hypothetical protein BDY19DRAFT_236263 [Irpex rosettiformis]
MSAAQDYGGSLIFRMTFRKIPRKIPKTYRTCAQLIRGCGTVSRKRKLQPSEVQESSDTRHGIRILSHQYHGRWESHIYAEAVSLSQLLCMCYVCTSDLAAEFGDDSICRHTSPPLGRSGGSSAVPNEVYLATAILGILSACYEWLISRIHVCGAVGFLGTDVPRVSGPRTMPTRLIQ